MRWMQGEALQTVLSGKLGKAALQLARYQLIYSIAGLVLGLACVVGGMVLFFHGVVGSTSWIGSVLGAQSKLSDAAPGALLFVIGWFVVWTTRYYVRVENGQSPRRRVRKPATDDEED